jgi:uncharacterized protein YbgA (DUF1722 family)/uncharacterized protein YbbK (DUF523 family)
MQHNDPGAGSQPPIAAAPNRPRIAVSACLLGQAVRFDGGHRRDSFLTDRLAPHVEWVPVCPEVESGLSVPRETLRLVKGTGDPGPPRLLGSRTGRDHTDRLQAYAGRRIGELAAGPLDGYVLKRASPTCGLLRVRVYPEAAGAPPDRSGTGVFAQALRRLLPALPVTEEGRLHDAGLRAAFLHQVFTHHRLRTDVAAAGTASALVQAHADHKLLLMAHSPDGQRQLGRLVAQLRVRPLPELVEGYTAGAMAALAETASPGRHANVLHHILGYLRPVLTDADRREVVQLIAEFAAGLLRLEAPLALLAHHVRRLAPAGWLARQVYFQPVPRPLAAYAG